MPFVITHWINLVAMILLIITGFSIHFPFWGGFMGIARGVHVFLGFVLFINCIVRVIMAFFVKSAPDGGTRYQVTDYKTWLPQADNRHQLGAWIRYYLFFKKDHPLGAKLGVPQKISYLAIPILIIVMFYTGLALWAPTMNWAFFAVLLAISSVMCLLGFRFGRDIEKEAERQQTFFQNASHELKTPLMAIQGYAEGIQAGVMDTGSAAEVILEESDRMTELVEELLDISKIDMGRQQLALSEMDIRELLYDSIRAVESAAAASGITIAPDFSEEPIMVKCDDTQMRRAVTNILTNGLRYARSELRLTCRADRRQVTIRIQDDGDGIAEADLPHIFDRFYMGRSGKSGIGLALTREIIHLHKGTIRARNGDTGAVFEISIPVSR